MCGSFAEQNSTECQTSPRLRFYMYDGGHSASLPHLHKFIITIIIIITLCVIRVHFVIYVIGFIGGVVLLLLLLLPLPLLFGFIFRSNSLTLIATNAISSFSSFGVLNLLMSEQWCERHVATFPPILICVFYFSFLRSLLLPLYGSSYIYIFFFPPVQANNSFIRLMLVCECFYIDIYMKKKNSA